MTNNCLVTRLKGFVNNDELVKLGDMVIYNESTSNVTCRIDVPQVPPTSVSIRTYSNDGTLIREFNHANGNFTITPEEKKILVSDKYKLLVLSFDKTVNFDINQVLYSESLYALNMSTNIWFRSNTFDIVKLKALTLLSSLKLINNITNIVGALSDLAELPYLEVINIQETGIAGDLSDIASLERVNTINIKYCPQITVKRSTLNTLIARGVNIQYSQTPIEDV